MTYRVLLFTKDPDSDCHGYPDTIATGITKEAAEAIKDAFEEASRGLILSAANVSVEIEEELGYRPCIGCSARPTSGFWCDNCRQKA